MAITIKDIAKLADVSPATISCVLNKNKKISDKTRIKIMKIIEETGYTPNFFARGLANSRTNTIAVITPYVNCVLGDRYFGEGVSGIYETAKKNNFKIILEQATLDFTISKRYLELFKEHSIDGMLYIGSTMNDTYLVDFVGRGYPFILVNSFLENIDVSYVCVDNREIGYNAAKHFYSLGHRRIAFIYGSMNVSTTLEQYIGYKKFLDEKGIRTNADYVRTGDFKLSGGLKAGLELLELENKPTAVFCGNDLMAIGSIAAFKSKKLSVPRDIAVIGCDDIEMCEYEEPKVSSFTQNIFEIASIACEKLIEKINTGNQENGLKMKIQSKFIRRESCGGLDKISKRREKHK